MSLSLLSPLPDPTKALHDLRLENERLISQLGQVQEELRQERLKGAITERGIVELRAVLSPLYDGLRHIFGQIDDLRPDAPPQTKNSAAWEQWKQRLGGATARAIDALMVHGEMNQTQLRIILGCATRTVTNVVAALNQAKLIDKRDGKIRLKEL